MPSRFGKLLRRLRTQAGLTQEQLGERAMLNVRTIGRLESGALVNPTTDTIKRLADALEASGAARRELSTAAIGAEVIEHPGAEAVEAAGREVVEAAGGEARVPWRLPLPAGVAAAADELAMAVGIRWRAEYGHRQVRDPVPLTVRARQAADPASGVIPMAPDERIGWLADSWRRLPERRLVVLGEPGSGKTMLAIRLVLELLRDRGTSEPVPVVLGVRSWQPDRATFEDWLAGQLVREYPQLAATTAGGLTMAAALAGAHALLPILDGFDEIADDARREVVRTLDRSPLPFVLTSRPDAYDEAVADSAVLADAAVVLLTALTPQELADYLSRPGGCWEAVADQLTAEPLGPGVTRLAEALRSPLMATLARRIYDGSRYPEELLDGDRFPAAAAGRWARCPAGGAGGRAR